MKTLFPLLVHLGLLQTCFGKCYYPNGNEATIDWPCDENAENSACCAGAPFGFACLENGLCQGKDGKVIRGSCTDESWMSPDCPHFCLNWDSVGHDLVPCSNVTGRDTSYCCDEMPNCCDGGVGRFEVPPSNPRTWALLNSSSRQYVVVTPLSTTTSTSTSRTSDASSQPTADSAGTSAAATTSTNTMPAQTASGDSTDNQNQPEPSTQSAGLSTGAQAGIGVGAAVGALLVAAVAYLWWKLNKTKKMIEASPMPGSYPQPPQELPITTYYAGDARHKSELPVEPVAHELQGYHPHGEAELAGYPVYSPTPRVMMSNYTPQYRNEITKMMYVAGHTAEPSVETTTLVENIVRAQTIDMLLAAAELASRCGQAKFTANDLLFQIRHDRSRLARLRHLMRWKKLRKQVKTKDDAAAIDSPDPDEAEDLIEAAEEEEEEEEEDDIETTSHDPATADNKPLALHTGIPSLPPLPWSTPFSFFPSNIISDIPSITTLSTEDDMENERTALQHHLERDDVRTSDMTADEYDKWSKARTASFTSHKKTHFRAWCGLGVVADHKAKEKENVLEILGFLAYDWVQTLTERAVAVAALEEREQGTDITAGVKRKWEGPFMSGVKAWGMHGRFPLQPHHVRRAFELLTTPPKRYTAMSMPNGTCLGQRKRRRMVSGAVQWLFLQVMQANTCPLVLSESYS
ncbi:transcription initiation factor IID, 18kD subunit-domain-containing protein [Achaetomium macrosporum]|uniref:Transcription initiation factor IID, 18kD subunit-domain-containing protein n=1 Tax=Achaetomium macrosporum TaxID=79813 RepID=A0AAN7C3Z3_9PEZI|nr:transcription initiation factor IID, 18kD subunit-domain-containing protein [Achaetomium macrosporum]